MLKHTISDNCLTIYDSYKVSKNKLDSELRQIKNLHPKSKIWEREDSMPREWAVHNFLYDIHLFRSHTKDVDFNQPQCWLVRLAYRICGWVALKLIK